MTAPISRRGLMAGAAALMLAPAFALAKEPAITVMDPEQAHDKAKKGEVLLIDVRTPDEWKETGIPDGAHPIELAPSFLAKLTKLTGGDKTRPVAFMCATGARSEYVARELVKRGWTHVIDVAGGVFGGPKGKGWKAEGLPLIPYDGK